MRLVVADDSVLLREGIVRLLTEQGFDVVGQAADAEDLLRKVTAHLPDVAVIDIRMPPTHTDEGLQAAERLFETHPEVGVLMLSQYAESDYVVRLLRRRTRGVGYVLKDRVTRVEVLGSAVRRVGEGGSVVDPHVARLLVDRPRERGPLDELSAREREVLQLMAEGRTNAAIAERLVLSDRTVESHVRTILRKLDIGDTADDHRRVLAVIAFLRDEFQHQH